MSFIIKAEAEIVYGRFFIWDARSISSIYSWATTALGNRRRLIDFQENQEREAVQWLTGRLGARVSVPLDGRWGGRSHSAIDGRFRPAHRPGTHYPRTRGHGGREGGRQGYMGERVGSQSEGCVDEEAIEEGGKERCL